MKISFGAKLLTTPQQFIHRTDNEEDKQKAMRFIRGLKLMTESPVFSKNTQNDTIELKRTPSKKGHFNYHIYYKSPDITKTNSFENITMEIGNNLDLYEVLEAFKMISYADMYKKGIFSKEYSLFAGYNDYFQDAYGMSFSDFINTLGE